jgi:hypothetical protein
MGKKDGGLHMKKAYALAALTVVMGLSAGGTPASAQTVSEDLRRLYHDVYKEGHDGVRDLMYHLHHKCEEGDRRACVHLGMIIGENKEKREEWQREHPVLFGWFR